MNSTEPEPEPEAERCLPTSFPAGERPDAPYLFSGVSLGGVLEELEIVYRKRLETARNLGEESGAENLRGAYAVARSCLEAVLAVPEAPSAGSRAAEGAANGPTRTAADARTTPDAPLSEPPDGSS